MFKKNLMEWNKPLIGEAGNPWTHFCSLLILPSSGHKW